MTRVLVFALDSVVAWLLGGWMLATVVGACVMLYGLLLDDDEDEDE